MSEPLDLILSELQGLRQESRESLIKVTRIEEQIKDVGDHEARIRVLEQVIPADTEVRITALERWKYGLPIAGLTAVVSAGISAWTATRGT